MAGEPQELVARLERVEKQLERLAAAVEVLARQRNRDDRRLLSIATAAQRLGVSRNTTMRYLIQDRRIRTIKLNGRVRIPASEVERVEAEGFRPVRAGHRARIFPEAPDAAVEAAKFRARMQARRKSRGSGDAPLDETTVKD
jgi:excisionase family DNA binding protein